MKPFRSLPTLAICAMLLALPLLSLAPHVQAQENSNNWVDGGYAEELEAARVDGSVSQSPYTARSFDTPMYRTIEHILGPVPGITVTADVWQRNPQYAQRMLQKSAVAGIGNYIAMMYATPPADLALWIRDTGQTLGFLPKQAYAQGVGFSGLAPLLPIWKAFRNIAYLLLAVVMIIIGFMVMLRKKIDPKTVVTVQNALPRIVITLLLITFSYAIVGLMIDIMYLSMIVLISILISISNGILGADTATTYVSGSFWTVIGTMLEGTFRATDDILAVMGPWASISSNVAAVASGAVIALIAGALTPAAVLAGLAVPILLIVILGFAVLFGVMRLLVMLISSYVSIIISLIFAPLQLLVNAFPGNTSVESWFKNLFANFMVFPLTAVLLLVGRMLTSIEQNPFGSSVGVGNTPPLWGPPLLSPGGSHGMAGIIGLGLLFAIPSVVGSIKESLKAKPFVPAGPSAVIGPLGAGVGQVLTYGYQIAMVGGFLRGLRKTPDDKEKTPHAS